MQLQDPHRGFASNLPSLETSTGTYTQRINTPNPLTIPTGYQIDHVVDANGKSYTVNGTTLTTTTTSDNTTTTSTSYVTAGTNALQAAVAANNYALNYNNFIVYLAPVNETATFTYQYDQTVTTSNADSLYAEDESAAQYESTSSYDWDSISDSQLLMDDLTSDSQSDFVDSESDSESGLNESLSDSETGFMLQVILIQQVWNCMIRQVMSYRIV